MPRIAVALAKTTAGAAGTADWLYRLVDPGPRTIRRRPDIYRPRRHRRVIYEPFPAPGGGFLLQESGDKLLLENGVDAILLE